MYIYTYIYIGYIYMYIYIIYIGYSKNIFSKHYDVCLHQFSLLHIL